MLFVKNPLKHAAFNNSGSYFGNDLWMNYQVRLMAKPEQCKALIPDFSGEGTESKEAYTVFSKGHFSSFPPQGCEAQLSPSMAGQNSLKDKSESRDQ